LPRDASNTRERLLREAERLFASRGVHQATSREITEAAGQRNVSALTYHFGSREAVLWAILDRHNEPVDTIRASLLTDPIDQMPTRDLVGALLVAYASRLATEEGRDYLRIVAQLTDWFGTWREGPLSPTTLRRILAALEDRVPGRPAIRRDRVVDVVMLITAAFAERARLLSAGRPVELDEDAFLASLADVLVAAVEAPVGPRLVRRAPATSTR
jgi:TetR/AcrR family transcriptional regulator, regulator of cefoperazone and chloramphenicol sensitivity